MKVYGAVAVLLHLFLTWPQIDVSGQFRALTALLLGYLLNRRFDGPLDALEKRRSFASAGN